MTIPLTCLVTGSTSGLGTSWAKAFLKKGYIVYATARNLDKAKEVKSHQM